MNEFKGESAIVNKFMNEMMSDLYMFSSRILNRIFRDIDSTGIVTINGEMFLTNTIIRRSFCIHRSWVQQLTAAIYSTLVVDKEMEFYFLLI